jgi:cAMP-dependent protein kinase regulator
MSIAQLRIKAKQALLEGKYKKALEYYEEMFKADTSDLRVHVKLAELREKTGDTKGAIKDYVHIANAYAEDGFVVQAIAISKIILRLDPTKTQIRDRLKELSDERGEEWAISTMTPGDFEQATKDSGKIDRTKLSFERTPLLSGLSGDELEAFMDSLQLQHMEAGKVVYKEGDSGNYLYLIGMGSIRLETKNTSGKPKVISHLIEGDFFGEYAFMSRSQHQETATTETECSLLMISRRTFDGWVSKYPSIKDTVEDFYRRRILARVLAITPVFEGVPPEARMALANHFHLKTFKAGEKVVTEGEGGDSFYLIRSGTVRVTTQGMSSGGQEVELGTMRDGEFFGEVALLTAKPRTATVVAASNLELMELSRNDFIEIVGKFPSVRKVVEAYQKQRVQDTIRTLMNRKPG